MRLADILARHLRATPPSLSRSTMANRHLRHERCVVLCPAALMNRMHFCSVTSSRTRSLASTASLASASDILFRRSASSTAAIRSRVLASRAVSRASSTVSIQRSHPRTSLRLESFATQRVRSRRRIRDWSARSLQPSNAAPWARCSILMIMDPNRFLCRLSVEVCSHHRRNAWFCLWCDILNAILVMITRWRSLSSDASNQPLYARDR